MNMTENEAKRIIKNEKFWEGNARICEAFKTAMQALDEIQPYRALEQKLQSFYGEHDGLLEVVVNGLIRYNNKPNKTIKAVLLTDDDVDKWKVLKEKNEPKKVTEFYETVHLDFICPSCNEAVYGQPYKPNYCEHCGQKLDWSE